jgi:acylphosphatase
VALYFITLCKGLSFLSKHQTNNITCMRTAHLIIQGKVQGVFYRASAKKMADKLNVKGWIRNTEEGDVEALVAGDEAVLQQFISWCKEGPQGAHVTDVIVTPTKDMALIDFTIKR